MKSGSLKLVQFSALFSVLLFVSGCTDTSIEKPSVIEFGASQSEMVQSLNSHCTELSEHDIDPVKIPGATKQAQIDCYGFDYFGGSRLAEFVFADDSLILTWILVEADEIPAMEEAFIRRFGDPTFLGDDIIGFADAFAAVRNDVPEALFYASEIAPMVEQRMMQSENEPSEQ